MKQSLQPYLRKSPDELQGYLAFKRRGSKVEPKRGKGSRYKRKPKHSERGDY